MSTSSTSQPNDPQISQSLVQKSVSEYYGKTLSSGSDLKTDACCTAEALPSFAKPIVSQIHDEVLSKYYGCGIVLPENIEGCRVLDLGSGSGRDCYVLSKLVGEQGFVVGVDMTDEQLAVARRHQNYMKEKFAFAKSNVDFLKGDIEKLTDLGLQKQSFDCVVSNCVVNLAEDKRAVLQGAFDLLKDGGEFYFSDVYGDRRIPEDLQKDPVLYGECLSGALYINDFLDLAKSAGFADPRKVTGRTLEIGDEKAKAKVGHIQFYSVTYRMIKCKGLEPRCEDYGQAVRYKGSIANCKDSFELDADHKFETGRIYTVCGNTYLMLSKTRFKDHFDFWGDFSTHYGLYQDCGTSTAPSSLTAETANTEALGTSQGGNCC
jgi:arsenite methyltransferase